MLVNRRKTTRHVLGGLARIQARVGALPRDCRVSDISDGGVRLFAEGTEVPDDFLLLLEGAGGRARECRVVWRLGFEVGAQFTDLREPGYARRVVACAG